MENEDDMLNFNEDYIYSKKFENSLTEFLKKHPNGVPLRTAAQMLRMDEKDVEELLGDVLQRLRNKLDK